jgi:hypothetical protein
VLVDDEVDEPGDRCGYGYQPQSYRWPVVEPGYGHGDESTGSRYQETLLSKRVVTINPKMKPVMEARKCPSSGNSEMMYVIGEKNMQSPIPIKNHPPKRNKRVSTLFEFSCSLNA